MIGYPFTEQEAQAAYDAWGCNCGPAALAFALQVKPDAVRHAIPGFEQKRYTSPSMMKAALKTLGREFENVPTQSAIPRHLAMFGERVALVRVQWTGPWTAPGANPRWAYRRTHWVACWRMAPDWTGSEPWVFDVNGGIRSFVSWQAEIVPALTTLYKRADGDWFPTHIWRLEGAAT